MKLLIDRDFLAEVCLEKNPDNSVITTAMNIIRNQEIEFKLIEPLLMKNSNIKNYYEKLILKNSLSEELSNKNLFTKQNKL